MATVYAKASARCVVAAERQVCQPDEIGHVDLLGTQALVDAGSSNAAASHSLDKALRKVLRRWPKASRTIAAKRAGARTATLSAGSGTSRTTAESTFGGGRNAPGGTTNSEVTGSRPAASR
jgi:hypothetical protein